MHTPIKIGTRDSTLALWQATFVQDLIAALGLKSELVLVKSEGDLDLVTPLYAMGVEGIFTKTLDAALLNKRIDIAVHSMKDVPTQMAAGILQAAVLIRGSHRDVLVHGKNGDQNNKIIGTGSIRRSAMWLNKYPDDKIENLRGNVQTRLQKLKESNWIGAIFAEAGLSRLDILPKDSEVLEWMLPAPGQGAIMIVCRENDLDMMKVGDELNDETTELCTKIERDFLKTLLGGCSTPVSAYARMIGDDIVFDGNIISTDGRHIIEISETINAFDATNLGNLAGQNVLNRGGAEIVQSIRNGRGIN